VFRPINATLVAQFKDVNSEAIMAVGRTDRPVHSYNERPYPRVAHGDR
jgi:hypothetical protein